jgi:hypothetical protein
LGLNLGGKGDYLEGRGCGNNILLLWLENIIFLFGGGLEQFLELFINYNIYFYRII